MTFYAELLVTALRSLEAFARWYGLVSDSRDLFITGSVKGFCLANPLGQPGYCEYTAAYEATVKTMGKETGRTNVRLVVRGIAWRSALFRLLFSYRRHMLYHSGCVAIPVANDAGRPNWIRILVAYDRDGVVYRYGGGGVLVSGSQSRNQR